MSLKKTNSSPSSLSSLLLLLLRLMLAAISCTGSDFKDATPLTTRFMADIPVNYKLLLNVSEGNWPTFPAEESAASTLKSVSTSSTTSKSTIASAFISSPSSQTTQLTTLAPTIATTTTASSSVEKKDEAAAAKEEEELAKAKIAEAMTRSFKDILEEVNADGESSNVVTSPLSANVSNGSTNIAVPAATGRSEPRKKGRVYWLRKVSGSGCPYAASWLAHINLYKKLT